MHARQGTFIRRTARNSGFDNRSFDPRGKPYRNDDPRLGFEDSPVTVRGGRSQFESDYEQNDYYEDDRYGTPVSYSRRNEHYSDNVMREHNYEEPMNHGYRRLSRNLERFPQGDMGGRRHLERGGGHRMGGAGNRHMNDMDKGMYRDNGRHEAYYEAPYYDDGTYVAASGSVYHDALPERRAKMVTPDARDRGERTAHGRRFEDEGRADGRDGSRRSGEAGNEREERRAGSMRSGQSEATRTRASSEASQASSAGTGASAPSGPSTRTERRKLDAKAFALSMELIEHVSKGRLQLAEQKIGQGANPDFADYDKRTPLHLAASEGHVGVVKMLLSHGANADVQDRWGSKPVDDAVKHGFEEIAGMLRKYSDDEETLPKAQHDGLELLECCAGGDVEAAKRLIAAGAQAGFADYDGRTGLHLAACEGHAEIAALLLRNGADAGAKDRFGRTAVDDALRNGRLAVLRALEAGGAGVPDHVFDQSCTPAFQRNMRLIDACARGRIGAAHKLVTDGADAAFGDYDRRTALHLACAEGHAQVAKLLLCAGADVAAEDRWGATPLEEAIKYEHADVVKMLEDNVAAKSA